MPGCSKPATDIDHDHVNPRIRGYLCSGHNSGLGQFGDSAEGLRAAIAYLERSVPAKD